VIILTHIPIARQRLSKHIQTNTQILERCSPWVLAATVAREQPACQWTGRVTTTWEPPSHKLATIEELCSLCDPSPSSLRGTEDRLQQLSSEVPREQ
jgi:hypothetical protein